MAIKTGSVLEKLCRDVDKFHGRVDRATERVEDLREQYRNAHWSLKRDLAGKGFRAARTLEKAKADLAAAELALKTEEQQLAQPDSFLWFA